MSDSKDLEHLRRIPFKDIVKATKNFTTVIGVSGYGPVYKGELTLSGNPTFVAVKRLDYEKSGQGLKEFLTERQLLSHYKHPNVVSLLGYCEEGREKILIYEYAERGSFEDYLNPAKHKYCPLTWKQRMSICIDAARGLDYLHNPVTGNQRVIHRDIKSGNILIDQNWKAMIADLGLSKLGRANENVTYLITNAVGTLGYCDPVYIDGGVLTKESDVYSFGVVLFEALCGRLFFMEVPGKERLFVRLARNYYDQGKLDVIIDVDLRDLESVKKFSKIAYRCLQDDRTGRPSMDLVLQEIEEALRLQELEEIYELQVRESMEALVLRELLEAFELEETHSLQVRESLEALVLKELLEAFELEETHSLQELQEALRLQEYEEACELLQILDEALGLQKLVETLEVTASVEAFLLKELDDAWGMQEHVEVLELHKHGDILKSEMDYTTIKATDMVLDTHPTYTTKEEIYTHLSPGVLLHDGKVWFSIDENGKNQEMISAMKFMHPDPNQCEANSRWSFVDDPTCKFMLAAKILDTTNVNMQVKIRPEFLSSNVSYAAFLVYKCDKDYKPYVVGAKYKLSKQSQSYISYPRYFYEHEWMMTELFRTGLERNVEFEILLLELNTPTSYKDVATIQGIIFLPIQKFDDEKIKREELENPLTSEIGWENRLPSDYEQFVFYSGKKMERKSQNYVITETKEEAYTILSRGVYITMEDGTDVWFWITKSNGMKCFMVSPESLNLIDQNLELSHPNESRFKYVLVTQASSVFVHFNITRCLLSANTSYACYLVYKMPQAFDNPVYVATTREVEGFTRHDGEKVYLSDYRNLYLSRSQSSTVLGPDPDGSEGDGMIINKIPILEIPSNRKDGWLEVKLWNFTTHDEQSIQKISPRWFCRKDELGDSQTRFPIFHSSYDHGILFTLSFGGAHNKEYYNIPISIQGVEFRPI